MCLVVGIIVWTLQAVNYFDFVVQDGHGLKTYFFLYYFELSKNHTQNNTLHFLFRFSICLKL